MIYLAIALIIIGLLFLVKALYASSDYNTKKPEQSKPKPEVPSNEKKTPKPKTSFRQANSNLAQPKQITQPKLNFPAPRPNPDATLAVEPLIMVGSFYLDHSQSLRNHNSKNTKLPANHYANIHRIGISQLIAKTNAFEIHSSNISYSYPTDELAQVLFQDELGFALIPRLGVQPTAIFLTPDSNLLKEHMKKHAKSPPLR